MLKEVLAVEPGNLAANHNLGILYVDFLQKPADAKPYLERFLADAAKDHPGRGYVEKKVAAMKWRVGVRERVRGGERVRVRVRVGVRERVRVGVRERVRVGVRSG